MIILIFGILTPDKFVLCCKIKLIAGKIGICIATMHVIDAEFVSPVPIR